MTSGLNHDPSGRTGIGLLSLTDQTSPFLNISAKTGGKSQICFQGKIRQPFMFTQVSELQHDLWGHGTFKNIVKTVTRCPTLTS